METEYLLNVGIDVATAEFESFCDQEYSLSSLVRRKLLKTATALVQFRLELVAGDGQEDARIEFKPAPEGQCILDFNPSYMRSGAVLEDEGLIISEMLFHDFVIYLSQRGYLHGNSRPAHEAREQLMAELRELDAKSEGRVSDLKAKHKAERGSLFTEGEPSLRELMSGLTSFRQGLEQRSLDDLTETLKWYLDEYAEFPQLVSSGTSQGEDRAASRSYIERKILEAVSRLREAGMAATDDAVAARLPMGPTDRSYTRETVNRYRQRMRRRGMDV